MNKTNIQKEMDALIEHNRAAGIRPSLLLHVCCAVCASYVLEYLHAYFAITIAYYNPNITDEAEYRYRYSELRRYVDEAGLSDIRYTEVEYDPTVFFSLAQGREEDREGGARCALCFRERLGYTARLAKEGGYDYFATTLTISPLKNAEVLNAIGTKLGEELGIHYLPSDFKKKNGYKRSIELSREYHLYRQNFCGCIFSQKEAQRRGSTQ
jgi:hypothetical protein